MERGYLASFDAENDQINFTHQFDQEKQSFVVGMWEDFADNAWVAFFNSLVQIKQKGTLIEHDFPRVAVGDLGINVINSVALDRDQNLWIGTAINGLLVLRERLDTLEKISFDQIQFTKEDGLRSRGFIEGATVIDSKNQIWFGSKNRGATVRDLNTFQLPLKAPEGLGLLNIDVQESQIDFRKLMDTSYQNNLAFGKQLSESFDSVVPFSNYPSSLTLPYDLNHLTFQFSAQDWSAPHKIKYSYRMEGLDKSWSKPNETANAGYRNLSHGTFTFKVKAIGEAGIWSKPIAYSFTIRPPWWHTWWAYALYVLLAVSAIGGYFMRLRRKIREKQEQLEREQYLNRELRELNIATTRFVPSDFVQILNKDALQELKLGDQTQATMTVLFADIRDYTSLSESMSPEDNFKFINAYLRRMGPIIKEHGGFICQYFGDGIMALFKDNHDLAVKAATEMQRALERYNRKRFAHNRPAIQVGIGLNTGQLMLGVIGDEQRYDSTVISDAVNTASRMEGLTKVFGCRVIVSEKTLMELNITEDEESDTLGGNYRFLGKVKVKGKEKVLKIYDFYDGETEDIRRLKTDTKILFEKGLQLYYDQKFGKAADVFKVILEKYPSDVATNYYMDKSVKYIVDGVDEKWSGVELMVNK